MRFRGKPAFIILFNHEIDDSKKAYQHGSLNRWLVVWCASKRMTLSYLQVSVEPVTDGSTLVLLWRFEWEVCICSEVWQAIVQWWHIVLHISCKNIEIISIDTDGNTLSSFKPRAYELSSPFFWFNEGITSTIIVLILSNVVISINLIVFQQEVNWFHIITF